MGSVSFSQIWNASNNQWLPSGLEQFFSGKKELGQIQRKIHRFQDPVESSNSVGGYPGLQSVMHKIYSILQRFFQWIGFEKLSNYFQVRAIHCSYNIDHAKFATQNNYLKNHLIAPMRNVHQLATEDFYLHSPIGNSKFCSTKGVCRGITKWFAYLYLQSQSLTQDSDLRVKAVAQLFSKGAPAQSTLVQATIPGVESRYFSDKFERTRDIHFVGSKSIAEEYAKAGIEKKAAASQASTAVESTAKNVELIAAGILKESETRFKKLNEGVYTIGAFNKKKVDGKSKLCGHAMTYIKVSSYLSYLVDPNLGAIKLSGKQDQKYAYSYINQHYSKNGMFNLRRRCLKSTDSSTPSQAPLKKAEIQLLPSLPLSA